MLLNYAINHIRYLILYPWLYLICLSLAYADEVILIDGSHLKGEVVEKETDVLQFKTNFAGTLRIKWAQVKKLHVDKPVKILLDNKHIIQANSISNNEKQVTIKLDENQSTTTMSSLDKAYINPPQWKQGIGYKFSGRFNFALKSQHGNTVKEELDLDGRTEFRRVDDRLQFTGELEHDTNYSSQTADNWLLLSRYDRFYEKRRYRGGFLSLDHDRFTDLQLRSIAGLHLGQEFYKSKDLNLDASVGLAYVYENNYSAADDRYLAGVWSLEYDNFMFDEFTQFYHRQLGRWNLEDTQRVILKSWTGFRFPLVHGFFGNIVASVELEADYDSQPNAGIGTTDTTYRIKMGYEW